MNHNSQYPQLTEFLNRQIQPESMAMFPRQQYFDATGKRKQSEYQPYLLTSVGGVLRPIVICWQPQGAHPIEFSLANWREAPLVEGCRIVTVRQPLQTDVIIDLESPNGWPVRFVVPREFADASLFWKF